jgi:hypothetical protein
MGDNKTAASILTLALWNTKERAKGEAKAEATGSDDWQLVIEDYVKILSELNRRTLL